MESKDSASWVWAFLALSVVLGFLALFAAIAESVGPFGPSERMMTGGTWGWWTLMIMVPTLFLMGLLLVSLASVREAEYEAAQLPFTTWR